MKIIIAPDSFKGSLTSTEAATAIQRGLHKAGIMDTTIVPMADGGEGTVEALITATGGKLIERTVTGPMGDPTNAFYGILGDGATAVIEMAAASGLPLVDSDRRNPLVATTYGTGELIKDAVDRGCRKLIIGIGGSATNDGGAGMAMALGAKLLDADGNPLPYGGGELHKLDRIDTSGMDSIYQSLDIKVACDVTNPLCGENGASAVYGPQKGATPEMVKALDEGLRHYADIIKRDLSADILDLAGSGAAGGLGGGLVAFLGAKLMSGIDIITQANDMEQRIKACDLVITGEGRTDEQTLYGKVPAGLAAIAQRYGKPVICLSGSLGVGYEALYDHGITACYSISDGPMPLERAMSDGERLLEQTACAIGRTASAWR